LCKSGQRQSLDVEKFFVETSTNGLQVSFNFQCSLLILTNTYFRDYASANVRVRVIKVLSDVFTNLNSSIITICAAASALSDFGLEVMRAVEFKFSCFKCLGGFDGSCADCWTIGRTY
jgi:hypothetical protein